MSGPAAPPYRDYATYRSRQRPLKNLPEVHPGDDLWDKASNYFYYNWKGPVEAAPRIVRVLDVSKPVVGSSVDRGKFYSYRHHLGNIRLTDAWMRGGNEKRLFHGTVRTCGLGNPKTKKTTVNSQLGETNVNCCPRPDCSLCNIIQESFKCPHASEPSPQRRYGNGVYLTETPSRALQDEFQGRNPRSQRGQYADIVNRMGPYRTVLLCRVLRGRPWYARNEAFGELQKPPRGFDSVVARAGAGQGRDMLKDDETVIYKDSAVMPWLLIVVDPRQSAASHPALRASPQGAPGSPIVIAYAMSAREVRNRSEDAGTSDDFEFVDRFNELAM